ncbi:MAG UNVERIFIED_CONTAM: hypothetical protein LVR18_03995 [Planctomycetaceae bacterium]
MVLPHGKSAKCDIAIGRATRFTGRLRLRDVEFRDQGAGIADIQWESLINASEH